MDNYLSDHFSLDEAIASETASRKGIDNMPSLADKLIMQKTAVKLEKVRALLGNRSIHINSWFRCRNLNFAIGSKDSSQHIKGEAVDFICPSFGSPADICKELVAHKDLIQFDQLILEHTWVHISFAILSGKPRYEVLSLLGNGGYVIGLTDKTGKSL